MCSLRTKIYRVSHIKSKTIFCSFEIWRMNHFENLTRLLKKFYFSSIMCEFWHKRLEIILYDIGCSLYMCTLLEPRVCSVCARVKLVVCVYRTQKITWRVTWSFVLSPFSHDLYRTRNPLVMIYKGLGTI